MNIAISMALQFAIVLVIYSCCSRYRIWLVIDLARNILPCDSKCRNGQTKDGLIGYELEGKTFGIIGLGAIGQRVAKIANAFGCDVIAYNRSEKNIDGVVQLSMEEVLKQSDIVSIHVPQTKKLLD